MPDVKPIHAVDNAAAAAAVQRQRQPRQVRETRQTPSTSREPSTRLLETVSVARLDAVHQAARANTRNIAADRDQARATEKRLAEVEAVAGHARDIAEKGAQDEARPGPVERGRLQRELTQTADELQKLSGGQNYGLTRAGVTTRARAATTASIAHVATQRIGTARAEAQTRVRRLQQDELLARRTEATTESDIRRAEQERAREESMRFSQSRLRRDAASGLLAATSSE